MSIDEIIKRLNEIIEKIKELNKISESLSIYKNFWEENENDEKKKNNSTII